MRVASLRSGRGLHCVNVSWGCDDAVRRMLEGAAAAFRGAVRTRAWRAREAVMSDYTEWPAEELRIKRTTGAGTASK